MPLTASATPPEGYDDYSLAQTAETARAWRVTDTGEDEDAVWLPKSQCERHQCTCSGDRSYPVYVFRVPDWLATDKGLA